jgi:hypothetical protein
MSKQLTLYVECDKHSMLNVINTLRSPNRGECLEMPQYSKWDHPFKESLDSAILACTPKITYVNGMPLRVN